MSPITFTASRFPLHGLRLAALAICTMAILPLSAQTTPERDDPAAELTSFKVAPGFTVSLFASEKEGIVKPIAHRIDRLGRVWVIGSTTYPQIRPGEVPNDYVKILEDTNGDGRADKVTTFAEGLLIPTGLEIDPDARGCWVGEGTKLWHLRDEDGDGRADKKEVVLRGFGTGDNHQNINSFRWSPGGDLLMSQGLHAFSRVETPHGITRLDEAGYFRFRPDRRQLDAFWGGPADPQNPWGFAWDDWGALFVQAGNNGGLFDALPSAFIGGVAKRPASIWDGARGRKCSNPDFVGTSHFPPEWRGALIVPGYINNAVWTLRLSPDGSGWTARDAEPLITSTHGSFRPMDAKFAPDGSLYLTDWYNPIIGHYQASFRHPDRDKAHGRIWRITATGRPLATPLPFLAKGADASVPELLAGLESGERVVREHARQLLGTKPKDVLPAVAAWATQADTDRAIFDALCIHEWQGVEHAALLHRALEAKEARLRAYALGVAARSPGFQAAATRDGQLQAAARDAAPRVRLAAVMAAADPAIRDFKTVLAAGEAAGDKFLDFARKEALRRLEPIWKPVLASGETSSWKPEWVATLRGLSGGTPPATPSTAPKVDAKVTAMVYDALKQGSEAKSIAVASAPAIASLAAEVREKGDAKRGREIYRRAELACVTCHRIGEEGGQIGPDLTNLGSAQPLDFIIGAVLDPQREIKEGFETKELQLKDGRTLVGFRRAAEAGELALLEAGTQHEVRVKQADVKSEKTLGSMMPAGLLNQLPREDQRDLFRYLSELGKAR